MVSPTTPLRYIMGNLKVHVSEGTNSIYDFGLERLKGVPPVMTTNYFCLKEMGFITFLTFIFDFV